MVFASKPHRIFGVINDQSTIPSAVRCKAIVRNIMASMIKLYMYIIAYIVDGLLLEEFGDSRGSTEVS